MVSTVKKSQARIPPPVGAGTPATSCPPSRRGIKPVAAQGGADGGSRDLDAQPEQLASDALVAPARILLREAHDLRLQVLV
jgi:hypothetical protein